MGLVLQISTSIFLSSSKGHLASIPQTLSLVFNILDRLSVPAFQQAILSLGMIAGGQECLPIATETDVGEDEPSRLLRKDKGQFF